MLLNAGDGQKLKKSVILQTTDNYKKNKKYNLRGNSQPHGRCGTFISSLFSSGIKIRPDPVGVCKAFSV